MSTIKKDISDSHFHFRGAAEGKGRKGPIVLVFCSHGLYPMGKYEISSVRRLVFSGAQAGPGDLIID